MITDKSKRPFRDLRVSVTDRCNFRCTYCMPAEIYGESYQFLPKSDLLTFEEIARLVKIFVRLGAEKVRLTGGEPLLRKNIEVLVAQLSQIEGISDLALTTNAFQLAQKAQVLKDSGLDRITVSLDTLDDEIFGQTNGRGIKTRKVLEGIKSAEQAKLTPIKINAVVQRGVNDHTIIDLARYFKERGHTIRFIEYMDVGNRNKWELGQVVPMKQIIEKINAEMPLEPVESSYRGEVALRYRYLDGGGEIGIIASVTAPFCGDCTRLRLSPEGKMFTCLFATYGTDLRGPMREGATDAELENIFTSTWLSRTDRYSEERSSITKPLGNKVEMYHIGG